ncbi:MAG: P-loop NTPase [Pseudonocardiaceae bacterium]
MSHKILTSTEIVLVCGGKGGVGKSTVAVNLAALLARTDLQPQVGLLDADLQGPSIPTMLGLSGRPKVIQGKIQPVALNGLKIMSTGLLASPEQTFAWKGPLLRGALKQMLRDVAWGDLDVLIIDTPPGTGDLHLALMALVDVAGVVVVTTPQRVALADTRRCMTMLRLMGVPFRAVVQNMSYFVCPHCETRASVFDHGGHGSVSSLLAAEVDVPIYELPILSAIAEHGDSGLPIVDTQAGRDAGLPQIFARIATSALSEGFSNIDVDT